MNKKIVLCYLALWIFSIIGLTGCRHEKLITVKVSGTITIDGKPIEQGSIKFVDIDGQIPTGGGSISNGTFIADVPPGKKKVLVNAFKVIGQEPLYQDVPDSPLQDKRKSVVPSGYNVASVTPLTAEITRPLDNLNFELSSKFKQ